MSSGSIVDPHATRTELNAGGRSHTKDNGKVVQNPSGFPSSPSLLVTFPANPLGCIHLNPNAPSPLLEQRNASNRYTRLLLLNEPSTLHALTPELVAALSSRLSNPIPTLFILDSTPAKRPAFCSGGNVLNIRHMLPHRMDLADSFFRYQFRLDFRMQQHATPIVALMRGVVMGGGAGLARYSTYRVATEDTVFAMPETAIGLVPDVGASWFLNKLKGDGLGLYLALTGSRLKGRQVMTAGFATHYLAEENMDSFKAMLMAKKFSSKQDLQDALDHICETTDEDEKVEGWRVIKTCFTRVNTVEDVLQKLITVVKEGKEDAKFAKELQEKLERMCPTSLKLAMELHQWGRGKSLKECLELEFRVVARCIRRHDYAEGIETVLVKKNRTRANWKPRRLEEVTIDMVQEFFKPLKSDLRIPELGLDSNDFLSPAKSIDARL